MPRIIPPVKFNLKPDYPEWMNPGIVANAGKKNREEINKLTKKALVQSKVTASYFCIDCNKVTQASNNAFIKQATQAHKLNIAFKPECPSCGEEVQPYRVVEASKVISNTHSENIERRVDLQRVSSDACEEDCNCEEEMDKTSSLQRQASSKGVYNTFIDQKIVYKVIESLGKYANKHGMTGCRARYLKGEHRKEAGSDTSILNNIECNLEWMYGRNQKGNATAKASIDLAGKITLPKVFKVASGMEYPFEEKYIRQIEREPNLFDSIPSLKKSDTITFRKPDPTRFHAYASKSIKVGEYKKSLQNA